jgi:hypothetical protein
MVRVAASWTEILLRNLFITRYACILGLFACFRPAPEARMRAGRRQDEGRMKAGRRQGGGRNPSFGSFSRHFRPATITIFLSPMFLSKLWPLLTSGLRPLTGGKSGFRPLYPLLNTCQLCSCILVALSAATPYAAMAYDAEKCLRRWPPIWPRQTRPSPQPLMP